MSHTTFRRSNTLASCKELKPSNQQARNPHRSTTGYSNGALFQLEGVVLPPEEVELKYQRWIRELKSCIQILQKGELNRVDKSAEIEELTAFWLKHHFDLSLEVEGCTRADIVFYILCFLHACNNTSEIMQPVELIELIDVFNEVALLSCNHNKFEADQFPTALAVEDLWNRVSSFVVQHFFSAKLVSEHVTTLNKVKEVGMFTLSKELTAKKKKYFIQNEKKPNANHGYIWTNTPGHIVNAFIPLCNRVFSHLTREKSLYNAFPVTQLPLIPYSVIGQFQAWVKEQTSIDVEDDLRGNYIELSHEGQIPMGGREQAKRKRDSRHDHAASLSILESELGYDTTFRLSEMVNAKPAVVGSDPQHPHYAPLVITLWSLRMFQNLRHKFTKHNLILPTEFSLIDGLKDKPLFSNTLHNVTRMPIVVYLQWKWYIQFDEGWIRCPCVCSALLGWARIMHDRFGGVIPNSNGVNINTHYYIPFFGTDVNIHKRYHREYDSEDEEEQKYPS